MSRQKSSLCCHLAHCAEFLKINPSRDISQMNGDIFRYVLSTNSFLCDIRQLRYSQNNTGYQIIKIIKYTFTLFLKTETLHCFAYISAP